MKQRVLLKLSGELLAGDKRKGWAIDDDAAYSMLSRINEVRGRRDLELAIAVGGGNVFRGRDARGVLGGRLTTLSADYIGLLGTVINGRAILDVLRALGARAVLFSDIVDDRIAERFNPDPEIVRRLFAADTVLVFTGSGDPGDGITSDTVGALKAIQLGCTLLMKGTKLDGIYDRDPSLPGAQRYDQVDYGEIIAKRLGGMDEEALLKCRRAGLPIRVFRFGADHLEGFERALDGLAGTLITQPGAP